MVIQYADDTQLSVSGPKSQLHHTLARLEHVLASLDDWLRFDGLKVNAEKKNTADAVWKPSKPSDCSPFHCQIPRSLSHPLFGRQKSRTCLSLYNCWNLYVVLVSKRCFGMLTGLSRLKHSLPAYILITLGECLGFVAGAVLLVSVRQPYETRPRTGTILLDLQ